MFRSFKSAFAAVTIAAGTLFAASGTASAMPAASGLATSGVAGIAADASQVTKVGRRHHHRHRRHYRHWGGPSIYFGFGAPYYYGGYPYYYGSPYYYRPRYRSHRRYYGGGGRCTRAHRACVARWGYGGGDYAGCMRYEGCRPR